SQQPTEAVGRDFPGEGVHPNHLPTTGRRGSQLKEGFPMRRIVWGAAVLGLLLGLGGSARADLITFSGSGTSGTISTPPGSVSWTLVTDPLNPAQDVWGIPGIGLGSLGWPGSGTETQFTITFTGLPAGVVINPLPVPTPGGFTDATRFEVEGPSTLWTR